MPRINCRTIAEPQEETRPIYKKNGSNIEPFIVGKGDIDYICGRCDNIIAQNVFFKSDSLRCSISMSKLPSIQ